MVEQFRRRSENSYMKKLLAFVSLCVFAHAAFAQSNNVVGNWKNPTGSVIQIYECGPEICARLIAISSTAPSHRDEDNPNPALRNRPLCGVQIGAGFHLSGSDRAEGGWLYDPESGKTYHGTMTRSGSILRLRGYVGLSIFGRTEIWTRAPANLPACHP